ncbi:MULTISPECIES: outer membrane beta-barrel protein [unclassified Bradyrhizobium]
MRYVVAVGVLMALNGTDAFSADIVRPVVKAPPLPWTWNGFYIGGHFGGGSGITHVGDPYGPSIYGDDIRTPKALIGGQLGYNWQQAGSPWVFGLEADVSAVDVDGTNTCLAYSGLFVSANCRIRQDVMGTITGRVGQAFGPAGHSLAYVKGGAAFLSSRFSMTTNALDFFGRPEASVDANAVQWGWTIGLGVEHALAPAWSMKLEYDYANFGSRDIATPLGGLQTAPLDPAGLVETAGLPTGVRQDSHVVKLGVNYRPGVDASRGWDNRLAALLTATPSVSGWSAEVGARYWYSSGRYQNDLGMSTDQPLQNALISRLTYETTGHSGEVFGRVDSPARVFLKGFAGGGGLTSGHMNDEDWLPTYRNTAMAYSNTDQGRVEGTIAYATLDVGYTLLETPGAKFGAFAGYNFYRDRKDSYGCVQIAYPGGGVICAVPSPTTGITISQSEDWHSLRIGVNGIVTIAPGLKLTADAAYLPYVSVSGLDTHYLRSDEPSPYSPANGTGRGMQLEAVLTYDVTERFSVGVGGRFWSMWATDVFTRGFGSPFPTSTLPIRAERFGTFLQTSYKFDAVN